MKLWRVYYNLRLPRISRRTGSGLPPVATEKGSIEVAEALLEAGADLGAGAGAWPPRWPPRLAKVRCRWGDSAEGRSGHPKPSPWATTGMDRKNDEKILKLLT